MTIKNTLFNTDDLSHSISVRDSNEYETKFPHQDLWGKQDAILKWISVLERFQELYPENGVKVVDLGCARGCVPHIIDSWGNDVTGVDAPECGGRLDHDCRPPRPAPGVPGIRLSHARSARGCCRGLSRTSPPSQRGCGCARGLRRPCGVRRERSLRDRRANRRPYRLCRTT